MPVSELRQLSEKQKVPVDLDTYIRKLANSRKRVLLVNDILQNVQVQSSFIGPTTFHTKGKVFKRCCGV